MVDKMYGNLTLEDWDVKGNELFGAIDNFGLVISIGTFDQELVDENSDIHFEQDGIGFLLYVYSMMDHKSTMCAFTSLQETVYFINSYIKNSNSIDDVKTFYRNYRISSDISNAKGYSS